MNSYYILRLLHHQHRKGWQIPAYQDFADTVLARESRLSSGLLRRKEFSEFTAADKERQLEDALMLPDPITELTIAMEVDYFQLNRAEYFVPVIVKIPGRELALRKTPRR